MLHLALAGDGAVADYSENFRENGTLKSQTTFKYDDGSGNFGSASTVSYENAVATLQETQ